jgi:hypothetical protein
MTAISILPEGHYYRGNLHGHSTCSDGRDSPEEVIRLYRQADMTSPACLNITGRTPDFARSLLSTCRAITAKSS